MTTSRKLPRRPAKANTPADKVRTAEGARKRRGGANRKQKPAKNKVPALPDDVEVSEAEHLKALKDSLARASEQRRAFIKAVLDFDIVRDAHDMRERQPKFTKKINKALRELGLSIEAARADALRAEGDDQNIDSLLQLFLPSPPKTAEEQRADADAARRAYARQSIEDFITALRSAHEPEPANIERLAEAIHRAANLLLVSAHKADGDHAELIAAALLPAAGAALALSDFVNGPDVAELAPEAHAAARTEAERWPRVHHAVGKFNDEADATFREWQIGRALYQGTHATPHSRAFHSTLTALTHLLPTVLHPRRYTLPILFDAAGRPVAPRTSDSKLAEPYLVLARFIAAMRHTPAAWQARRAKALGDFLVANDNALARLPSAVRNRIAADYKRTRKTLAAAVARLHLTPQSNEEAAPPPPAWIRPAAPVIGASGKPWSKDSDQILRAEHRRILADALTPIYDRSMAELDSRAAASRQPRK